MAITQTVEILADRRITLEVPREVPTGQVILTFTPVPAIVPESPELSDDFEELYGIFEGKEALDKKELRRMFHEKYRG